MSITETLNKYATYSYDDHDDEGLQLCDERAARGSAKLTSIHWSQPELDETAINVIAYTLGHIHFGNSVAQILKLV